MHKSPRILFFALSLLLLSACGQQPASSDASAENVVSGASKKGLATGPDESWSGSEPADSQETGDAPRILIFGDSITAGFGIDSELAFPALLQARLDSLGWNFKIIDGGLSGDTSAGGLRRINWMLREPVDYLVLELGGNDGLRGTSPDVTMQNLQAIIDEVKARNPNVQIILAGMQIPPNLGQEYTDRFKNVFPTLAEENDAHLIPFLLKGVGGVPSLNQPDGIHPTAEGHKIVAENVWNVLEPLLVNHASL